MKFAMFTDTFKPSTNGIVSAMSAMIEGLHQNGVTSIVFAPGDKTTVEKTKWGKIYYFKSRPNPFYKDMYAVSLKEIFSKCEKAAKKENADLYVIEDLLPLGMYGSHLAKKHKKPVFGIYHTNYEEYAGHLTGGKFKKILNYGIGKPGMILVKKIHNSYDYTIAVSEESWVYLIKKEIKNAVYIPNPIDFNRLKGPRLDVRKKFGIIKNKKMLLYVGRISFEKSIDILIHAINHLDNSYTLVLVGKGPDLERIRKLVDELGLNKRVILAGYVPDKELGNYYKQSDLFVSPSASETQGMTFAEAMSFGIPSVGADRMGSKAMIEDGVNGYKFAHGDSKDLATKIKLIFSDTKKYASMKKNSIVMSKEFDKKNIAKHFIELYKLARI